ncbi:MAG TPA: hypothetical protein VGD22_19725 [Sphingobacteriaceae bacterium]
MKRVGPQYSSTIESSREFDVHIASYKPIESSIEKHEKYRINEVFAEYQYAHDGGLFSGFKVDRTATQIILTDSLKNKDWSNDTCSFAIKGFQSHHGSLQLSKRPVIFNSDTLTLLVVLSNFATSEKRVDELVYLKDK